MPKDLTKIYSNLNFFEKLYVYIRWHLCPFALIAEYLPQQGIIVDIGCGMGLLS